MSRSPKHQALWAWQKLKYWFTGSIPIDPCEYRFTHFSHEKGIDDKDIVTQHLACPCGKTSHAWSSNTDIILDWLTVRQFNKLKEEGIIYEQDLA